MFVCFLGMLIRASFRGGRGGAFAPPLSRALPLLRFSVMDDMVQLATAEYAKQMISRKSLCAYVH